MSRRDLRLASGLVLFAYVALHLVNHSLGLVSVAVAERGLEWALRLWHSGPGTIALYGAAAIHLALALDAIYARRTLRMATLDMVRIVLGLAIPTLLIGHAVGTRLAWELYSLSPHYSRVVGSLWAADGQGRQLALLVPGWLHGCLGIHLAFERRPAYQRLHPVWFAAALLLPVLGGLGFLAMGKELSADVSMRAHLDAGLAMPRDGGAVLLGLREALLAVYFSAIAAVFIARAARAAIERRFRALVTIEYPQRTVRVPRGWSVLEASRAHHLAHQSTCGGRARCSTCRVRVARGADQCPPPQGEEQATLARINAAAGVRLACQLRPQGDIAVVPLFAVGTQAAPGAWAPAVFEHEVVCLFVDWRNRDAMTRVLLPQDAVFLSRGFSETVAAAVQVAGGIECDAGASSIVAVFDSRAQAGFAMACRTALGAARRLDQALTALADRWNNEFGVTADFALCAHVGSAALGEIGSPTSSRLTLAGPVVESARRLRFAASAQGTRIAVSADVLRAAGASAVEIAALSVETTDGMKWSPAATLAALPNHLFAA